MPGRGEGVTTPSTLARRPSLRLDPQLLAERPPLLLLLPDRLRGAFGRARALGRQPERQQPPLDVGSLEVLPDLAGLAFIQYGSHYCSVDNRDNATTLACSMFNSGIRIFDIRDPARPKEIAYYNPAGATTASPGSNHVSLGQWVAGGPDWCTAQVHLDAAARGAAVRLDVGAGHLALQRAFQRLRVGPLQLIGIHRRDGLRQILFLDAGRLAGDHDVRQLEEVAHQIDVDRPGIGRDRQVLLLVPDEPDLQLHLAFRGVGDEEAAILLGIGTESGTRHCHRCAADARSGPRPAALHGL